MNWGYIDHGPVIAYLIRFFTILFENSFTVRLGGVVLLTTLCYLLYQFGKTYYSWKTGMILALTVCVNMMFHTSAIIMTPDAPLAFFTILAIIYYYKAYFIHEKYLYPAGLFMGLCILSKVSAIFPAIGIPKAIGFVLNIFSTPPYGCTNGGPDVITIPINPI